MYHAILRRDRLIKARTARRVRLSVPLSMRAESLDLDVRERPAYLSVDPIEFIKFPAPPGVFLGVSMTALVARDGSCTQ